MSKWPKAWIKAVVGRETLSNEEAIVDPVNAIDRLCAVGALKEPPLPVEIWWCVKCECQLFPPTKCSTSAIHLLCGEAGIKLRQVQDE
jgi:hypothetical protein